MSIPRIGLATAWVLAFVVGGTAPAAAADVPTDGQVAEQLLAQWASRLLDAADAAAPGASGVAMERPTGKNDVLVALQDELGNLFADRGYEVFTAPAGEELPADALRLDLELVHAGIDYPARRTGFLGLGRVHSLRRAVLELHGRLEDGRDGRWLYEESDRLQLERWVHESQEAALAEDRPLWFGSPLVEESRGAPWFERGLVLGLLAGVMILYFDGTR